VSGSDRTPQHAGLLEPGVSGNLRRSCARRLAQRQRAANLATIRAAVIAALKDDGYLHIPEGRRDHTTPRRTLRLHGLD
jgi:hypothetical protein